MTFILHKVFTILQEAIKYHKTTKEEDVSTMFRWIPIPTFLSWSNTFLHQYLKSSQFAAPGSNTIRRRQAVLGTRGFLHLIMFFADQTLWRNSFAGKPRAPLDIDFGSFRSWEVDPGFSEFAERGKDYGKLDLPPLFLAEQENNHEEKEKVWLFFSSFTILTHLLFLCRPL